MSLLMPPLIFSNVEFTLKGPSGPVEILRGIDLTVHAGEAVAIVGPSGSGKSSLVMLMAGLDLPSRGEIKVAGANMAAMSEDQRARFRSAHIGIVFQFFYLIPTMTALENTALPLEFLAAANARGRARDALEKVGLAERVDHYPSQLSGGEQQRVGLARAMIAQPPILLADEPTGNLDASNSSLISDLLFARHKEEKSCFVLVTHDFELAKKCDRCLRMENGLLHEIKHDELKV